MSLREELIDRSQYVDWWHADQSLRDFHQTLPMAHNARGFYDQFWPSTLPYFSPLNSVFSVQFRGNIDRINSRPAWILRDGMVPLLFFFKSIHAPKSIKSRIYVEAKLASIVPPEWRKHIGTYRIVSKDSPARLPDNILLCGSFSAHGHGHSLADLQTQLKSLGKNHPAGRKVFAFSPRRSSCRDDDETTELRYYTALHDFFGTHITPWSWVKVQYKANFAGHELIEIGGQQFIADTYTSHLVLARGGYLFTDPLTETESYFELSPYHGYALSEQLSEETRALSEYEMQHMVSQYGELYWLINE